MRRWMGIGVFAAVCACGACGAWAQDATVLGHVIAGDTGRPARFASVMLFAVPSGPGLTKADIDKMKGDKSADFGSLMGTIMGGMTLVTAQTGMDGTYTMKSVSPGDYYVFASAAGYETPRSVVQAAIDGGADLSKPLPGLQMVHVGANAQVLADVTMVRGASVSGTVSWDDGSPVSGAKVSVEPSTKSKDLPSSYSMLVTMAGAGSLGSLLSVTDDRGRFRLSGLTPGEYLVQVTLTTGGGAAMQNGHFDFSSARSSAPIVVWAPSAFHREDAKAIALHSGEESADELITVNLGGTHSVSGHVDALDSHAALNAGVVKLTDASDSKLVRSASVDNDGNYKVDFVPSGTYKLSVTEGAIKEASRKKQTGIFSSSMHTVRSFKEATSTVVVAGSDVTGQNLDLTAKAKTDQDIDPGEALGALLGGSKSKE